ncbi:MAG: hypothetical protein ABIH69_03185 [bacterium]
MRRILFSFFLISLMTCLANAQVFLGAKESGMGGCGVANSTGLTSIYYNPAGLMAGGSFGLKISLAPSYTDYQKVSDAFSNSSDIATFLTDNFASELAMEGDLAAQIGFNFNKIGISAIALPLGNYAGDTLVSNKSIFIEKAAFAPQARAAYSTRYDYILTLGRSFSNVDVGINIKSINAVYGTFSPAALATTAPFNTGTGNGTAYDIGLRSSVNVPLLGSAAVGIAMRDVAGKINYSRKQQTYYINNLTGAITTSANSDLADVSVDLDSTTLVGIAGKIDSINLGVAADLEMAKAGSTTHLGLEYPMFSNLIIARAGIATGPSISKTTYGAKLNLPILSLDATRIIDNNNSALTSWTVDIGLGI